MKKHRFMAVFLSGMFLIGLAGVTCEVRGQAEPSYEIVLQTVFASNDGDRGGRLPESLAAVINRIKTDFAFSGYTAGPTHIGRMKDKGSLQIVTVFSGFDADPMSTIRATWGLTGLSRPDESAERKTVEFGSFAFEAEIPFKTTTFNEKPGGMVPIVRNEQISFRCQRLGVEENSPTVIGTLGVPRTNRLIFLIITVKPVGYR